MECPYHLGYDLPVIETRVKSCSKCGTVLMSEAKLYACKICNRVFDVHGNEVPPLPPSVGSE